MTSLNVLSAKQRWKLLGSVLENPKLISKKIIVACRSQGAFANFELAENGISAVALNTLKASAKLAIEAQHGLDGWQQLEQRRHRVNLLVSEQASENKRRVKTDDKERIAELEDILNKASRERLRVLKGYFDLLGIVRELAKQDKALEARLNRHVHSFSLRSLLVIEGVANDS